MVKKRRLKYVGLLPCIMSKTLTYQIDAAPDDVFSQHCVWDWFTAPVTARGEYEVAKMLIEHEAQNLHPLWTDPLASFGLVISLEELATRIYVPKIILEADKERQKNRLSGIGQYFSKDDLNQFLVNRILMNLSGRFPKEDWPDKEYESKKDFIDYVLNGRGEEKWQKLQTDAKYQKSALLWSQMYLRQCHMQNTLTPLQPNYAKEYSPDAKRMLKLSNALIRMYAKEMSIQISE